MLTEQQSLEAGGKIWEKGAMKRIYLDSESIKSIVKCSSYSDFEEKKLKASRTYYDCVSGELKSDIGTVRVLLNQAGFKCGK